MIIKIFASSLIVIGSFLEIFYYAFRFSMDGIETWLSIIIGIALTLLLSLAVYKKIWTIIIIVSAYSILATSAGQSFSLTENQKIEETEKVQELYRHEEIEEIKNRINEINIQYKNIQDKIDSTVTSLKDRGYWRTTLATAEEKQQALDNERKQLNIRLKELRTEVKTTDKKVLSSNIYVFYNKLFGWPVDWFQFVMQTILSAFIAIMAPLGIVTIQGHSITQKEKPVKYDYTNYIKRWVRYNWLGIRTGKSSAILPLPIFNKFIKDRNEEFEQEKYNKILNAARKSNVIENNKIIELDENTAINRIKKVLT